MPAGLVIGVFNWFASHLVVWSLLGFFVAGLVVFGVVSLPMGAGPVSTAAAPTGRSVDKGPAIDHVDARQAGPVDEAAQPRPAVKRPKLIGGTLPLYEDLPASGQGSAAPGGDGFRPAADPTLAPSIAVPDYREQVQRARRAFWNGDFEASEAAYMDVIAAHPDDPEAFGELGNLYEAMGKAELARDAFFAAGVRLKQRGEQEKLRQVIDFLAEKGDERSALLVAP